MCGNHNLTTLGARSCPCPHQGTRERQNPVKRQPESLSKQQQHSKVKKKKKHKTQEERTLLEQSCRSSPLWAPGAERALRARGTATRLAVRWRRLWHPLSLPCLSPPHCFHLQHFPLSGTSAFLPHNPTRGGWGLVATQAYAHKAVTTGARLPRTLPLTWRALSLAEGICSEDLDVPPHTACSSLFEVHWSLIAISLRGSS